MKNAKVKEVDIWADMLINPEDHKQAFNYVLISAICIFGIVVIRILA